MGIRFRKRLKVAPGVYVNLSKSGFSTTTRLAKGISLNMGENGTFINTSIPGTGIYSRERLNWGQNNASKSMATNDDIGRFNTGCLWLTIFLVLMLSLGIFKAVENQDSILAVVCSLLLFVLLITCTWLILDKTRQSDYNYYEEELKKTRRVMHGLTDNETEKRKILSSYADCLDIELQIDLEEKIIQGLTVKRKKKFQKLIDEHTAKCVSLKAELESKRYDSCEGLSDEIIDSYKELCLSYEELKKSEGLLYRGAKWTNIELNYGVFDYLKSLVDVPAFANINGDIVFYIYPEFVIKSSSNTEFQVIPMDYVTLETSIIDITTRNKAYADCEDVSYDFLYTTKDGSPDMRYKDNPLIKTMKMNLIKFSFMDEDILVSNKKLCDEFVEKFKHHINFFKSEEDNNDVKVVNVAEKPIILQDADPLLKEAAEIILNHGKGSTSLIQRDLMIGYGRAIRITNQLEEIGIIGASDGSKPRDVLIKSQIELEKIMERIVCSENSAINEKSEEISNNDLQKKKSAGLSQLDILIGLESVKQEVKTMYNFVKIQMSREQNGLKKSSITYHCVFTGNPGTGKTTVARILAKIYKDLGVLKKGHLVETDRSGLVAEYVGQTAVKTNKIIDSALDGVLFIDEAYSLAVDGSDYGSEAIATLLKRMEDNRDRLIVILAGYTNEMKTFINSNPGLESRFSKYIEFPDYNADELFQILLSYSKKQDYLINKDAYEKLKVFIADALAHKDSNWGNARWVRNVFEQNLSRQANRLASMSEPTKEQLREITIEDCP